MMFDGDAREQPLFRVDKITHRDDAILPISVPGRITDESVCT
jgi:UbiD family decarboxylase